MQEIKVIVNNRKLGMGWELRVVLKWVGTKRQKAGHGSGIEGSLEMGRELRVVLKWVGTKT